MMLLLCCHQCSSSSSSSSTCSSTILSIKTVIFTQHNRTRLHSWRVKWHTPSPKLYAASLSWLGYGMSRQYASRKYWYCKYLKLSRRSQYIPFITNTRILAHSWVRIQHAQSPVCWIPERSPSEVRASWQGLYSRCYFPLTRRTNTFGAYLQVSCRQRHGRVGVRADGIISGGGICVCAQPSNYQICATFL